MSIPEPPEYSRVKVAVNNLLQEADFKEKGLVGLVVPYPPAEDQLALYIKTSRKSLMAFEACIMFVERFTENSQPIPRQLVSWIRDIAYGRITCPKKSGKSRYDNWPRNIFIVDAIRFAQNGYISAQNRPLSTEDGKLFGEKCGLKPFRNDASVPHSGCDLVSELLLENFNIILGYGAVKTVWNNRRK